MSIIGNRHKAFIFSAVLIVVSIVLLITPGLNFGIHFSGGTLLERSVEQHVTVDEIRTVVTNELELGTTTIQMLDDDHEFLIRTQELENEEIIRLDAALADAFGEVDARMTEVVFPVIGKELINQALIALAIAAIGILLYVSYRFEFKFAVCAIVALLHDVIIVLGIFAITRTELNIPFVAAILTLVGYSINDTIVIFDRIRDNLHFRKKKSYEAVVTTSIRQSISRSLNTSLTTFIVVFLLFIFGGAAISDFALALVLGVIFGTYSSLFISAPLWLEWNNYSKRKSLRYAKQST